MLGGVADDRDHDRADEELATGPSDSDAALIDPTSTSDITPTETPAIAEHRHRACGPTSPRSLSSLVGGVEDVRWVLSEKSSPTT